MSRPARAWDLALGLDDRPGVPLFRRISRAVVAEIERGRLRPGTRLPGSRTLAESLRVHRNTVLAAYEELIAEGWAESSRARGTFVSGSLPDVRLRRTHDRLARARVQPAIGFDLRPAAAPRDLAVTGPGTWLASGGVPDVRLAPFVPLARAYRRVIRTDPESLLSYGHPEGHPRLRAALASMLGATRGLTVGADDVVITSGSQMALDLVSRALLEPGDTVAIEDPGYARAWPAFRQTGARLVPIAVDAGGLDIEALSTLVARSPVRAVYVTPHHQYPTTATLSAGRRIALLELARRTRMAVIEDDYDHEYHYDGRPVLPLASADRAGTVIYVGSLAKVLAPGVRLGYAVAPRALIERIAIHRAHLDRQGDHAIECAAAELLEQGGVQRHARRARRIYRARRDYFVRALRRELGSALSFEVPAGGLTIWATVSADIDVEAWASRALDQSVTLYTARRFTYDGRVRPQIRLGFAPFDERELAALARKLRRAL
ncbi:MAG: PLP-dependent aminotransferase family protein [Steroidobacteraceae bacterium]